MKEFLQNFFKQNGFQPILTIVLIIVILLFAFQLFNQNNNSVIRETELTKRVSFDSAANRFLNEDFEIYTRGTLYVKENATQSVNPSNQGSVQSTPQPSVTQISLIENKYEDVFFLSNKGNIIKVDAKTFGINGSIFFNNKGQIVFLDNINKQYTLYKIPAEGEKKAIDLFDGLKFTFRENLFPLSPLIADYKARKFNPVENSSVPNIYTGKWQHPVYTNNEVVTVNVQTDPNTEMFNAISITGTNPPSILYFDFRKQDSIETYDSIPEGYKNVPVPAAYKEKEGQ